MSFIKDTRVNASGIFSSSNIPVVSISREPPSKGGFAYNRDDEIDRENGILYYGDGTQWIKVANESEIIHLLALIANLQSQVTTLSNQLAATNSQLAIVGENTPLNVNFIWLGLPPLALYQYTWGNVQNQIRNMVAGVGSTDANGMSVFGAPFFDGHLSPGVPNPPGDYHGWLNTADFTDVYFNPLFDGLYTNFTGGATVMVTEIVPKVLLLKIEVGYLGGNLTTLATDFITNITTPTSIASLALGVANFAALHPETSSRVQLPYQQSTLLMNDPPTISTFTTDNYIQASSTGQILNDVFSVITTLLSFVPVVGSAIGAGFSILQSALDIVSATQTVGVQTASPSVPWTNNNNFPNKAWTSNSSFLSYNVTESLLYIENVQTFVPNPPPVARTPANWNVVSNVPNNGLLGPWVNGVVSLGAGYQCRVSVDENIQAGPALFTITHFYQDAPLAPDLGNPGLIQAIEVKSGTSATVPLDGGGFNIKGTWSSQGYNVNDVVVVGGVAYAAILAVPGVALPQPSPPNAAFWAAGGIVNAGVWAPATIYSSITPDVVSFNGFPYTCVAQYQPPAAQPSPPNITYWEVLSAGGSVFSSYKYAQFSVEFSINNPNITDLFDNPVPAGWNAVYINGSLFAVFDGFTWHQSPTLMNP